MTTRLTGIHLRSVLVAATLVWLAFAAVVGGSVIAADIRTMTPNQAQSLIAGDTNVKILDIRTPREFRSGHIPGATNINFYSKSFRETLAKLDRSATYVMHCRRGVRSGASLRVFRDLGFRNVIHMPAGMDGWKRAGLTAAVR